MRYSTVAACLVLAVVIGVNGRTLIDKSQPAGEDGVAIVENNDYRPNRGEITETDIQPQSEAAGEPVFENNEAVTENVSNQPVLKSASAASTRSTGVIKPIHIMSESINQIDTSSSIKPPEPVYVEPSQANDTQQASRARIAGEDNSVDETNSHEEVSPGSFTIARGIYRLPSAEIAQAELEASPLAEEGVLLISEMEEQTEATIARGRYYIPADEGYIAIDNNNELGVNGEDAQRAAELIQQYADIQDDSYYVINSHNIPSMLEHMDGEGINYQNNMENAENGKVSFKLVIE